MLPKSRVFAVLLVGLGALLAAVGVTLPLFFHDDARLPLELSVPTVEMVDDKATSLVIGSPDNRLVTGKVVRRRSIRMQDPVDRNWATIRVGVSTMRVSHQEDLKKLIDASVWSYRINRVSGVALSPASVSTIPGMPPLNVDVEGHWLSMGTMPAPEDQLLFDETLRQSRVAKFSGEEQREGRKLYIWEQTIEPTNLATLFASPLNRVTITDEQGHNQPLFLFHSGQRTIWVDATTGIIVDAKETVDDYYGTADGEKKSQVLLFDGQMPSAQAETLLHQVKSVPNGRALSIVSWFLILVGLFFVFVGSVGVTRHLRTVVPRVRSRG